MKMARGTPVKFVLADIGVDSIDLLARICGDKICMPRAEDGPHLGCMHVCTASDLANLLSYIQKCFFNDSD